MSLLAATAELLRARGIAFAVIGAAALAVRGVARSTQDTDLLVADRSCLDRATWRTLPAGTELELAAGDSDDPLAGVVRLRAAGEGPLDVVVARHAWQAELLARAEPLELDGVAVPVVRAADLVLLKLYAGGPQDAWDIVQLLGGADASTLIGEVDEQIAPLPAEAQALWRGIRDRATTG